MPSTFLQWYSAELHSRIIFLSKKHKNSSCFFAHFSGTTFQDHISTPKSKSKVVIFSIASLKLHSRILSNKSSICFALFPRTTFQDPIFYPRKQKQVVNFFARFPKTTFYDPISKKSNRNSSMFLGRFAREY